MSAETEMVEIVGLVDGFGAGGGSVPGGPWTLRFSFDCWRDADGVFHSEALRIQREVSKSELGAWMKQIARYAIVRVRVALGKDGSAQLDAVVAVNAGDPQLEERLAELDKPVTHHDARFGLLTLEPRLRSWFSGEAEWQGATVKLMLHGADVAELKATLDVARKLWDEQASWDARRKASLIRDLLSLKNEGWLGEDEKPVGEQAFLTRSSLETISVNADGRLQFWHEDGDLFWGHAIEVSGEIDGDELEANIAG